MKRQFNSLLLSVVATGLLFPAVGLAQIEEIVVTAQKREENLQDTPIAITAFTEQSLEGRMINDISKLADFTPNVIFDTTTADQRFIQRRRGVHTGSRATGFWFNDGPRRRHLH